MSTYYLSACHDCKEKVMWSKVTQEKAEEWHESFHKNHKTEFSNDYDDDFRYGIRKYKNLGIQEGVDKSV